MNTYQFVKRMTLENKDGQEVEVVFRGTALHYTENHPYGSTVAAEHFTEVQEYSIESAGCDLTMDEFAEEFPGKDCADIVHEAACEQRY